MSTRATYRFLPSEPKWRKPVVFYIHHDGYPEGAASYFAAAAACANHHGGMPERFLRANDRAEFTGSHDVHGDTEYRYDVKEHKDKAPTLEACRVRSTGDFDNRDWDLFYTGPLADFINKHAAPEEQDDTIVACGQRLMRLGDALLEANNALTGAMHAFVQGWIGNASGSLVGIRRMIANLPMPYRGRLEDLANKLDARVTEAFAASRAAYDAKA